MKQQTIKRDKKREKETDFDSHANFETASKFHSWR